MDKTEALETSTVEFRKSSNKLKWIMVTDQLLSSLFFAREREVVSRERVCEGDYSFSYLDFETIENRKWNSRFNLPLPIVTWR